MTASSIARRLASTPCATRRGAPEAHAIDQRLHLDQQRPAAIARHRDEAPGHRLRVRDRKIADGLRTSRSPRRGHGEEAELFDRPEAILGGAQHAVAAAGVALEIQHRVDQVLEQLRPGDRALLGHVADDDDRGAPVDLAKRTSSAVHSRSCETAPASGPALPDCTVWIESTTKQRRALLAGERQDRFEQIGLAHQAQGLGAQPQAPRAQAHLRTDSSPLA